MIKFLTHTEEIDTSINKEILNELLTTEWGLLDKEHFGEVKRYFSKKEYVYLVRKIEDKKIIGYAIIEINMGVATIESVVFENSIYTEEAGKNLIRHIINKVKIKGCHVIKLETGTAWKSREIYEELGFKIRAILPDYYGDEEHILMDMRLRGVDNIR